MSLKNTWQDIRDHSFLQNLQIHVGASSLQFTKLIRSGNWDGHGRSFILCSVTHLCVDVCFGPLSWWKMHPQPIIRFLEEAIIFYLLIFDRIHDAMYLNKKNMPTTLMIQRYIKLYTWGTFYPCVFQIGWSLFLDERGGFFLKQHVVK